MTLNWSKKPLIFGTLYSLLICLAHEFLEIKISLPWQPISIIGIAVAFYLGFKNNSSYDRTWEARKIWGSIVNNSRAFGASVCAFVQGEQAEAIKRELIYRHIAWVTALRHQLRLAKPWEHTESRVKGMFADIVCEDYEKRLHLEMENLLSSSEAKTVMDATNTATQLLRIQQERLQALKDEGLYEDFRHMELHQLMVNLYADQGKSERIKNFPFPRQYASTALWLTIVFSALLPLGVHDVFGETSGWMFWLCPLISGLLIWCFFLMEKIGDYSENPFEGTYNDVPITNIARGIEIDLREMIADENIPAPTQDIDGFLL